MQAANDQTGDVARHGPFTLAIDIGGSKLKATVLDRTGVMITDRARVPTPHPASPRRVLRALASLVEPLPPFDRVSVGFPGVVRDGRILTAPNLDDRAWRGFDLAAALADQLGKPVRVLNDAEVQGLGVITGQGLECVLTLGTGMGFALFRNGHLMPHLELGQHPAPKKKSYDRYIGNAALERKGRRRWNRRLRKAIDAIDTLVNYDTLYLGGGNAAKISLDLPSNVHRVANIAGLTGGVKLWDREFGDLPDARGRDRQSAVAKRRSGDTGGIRAVAPSTDRP
jgi:polyphosphate glucokinase